MKSFALASGSTGNCIYVENDNQQGILLDCGLPYSKIEKILKDKNRSIKNIKAIFITHEHSDHVSGLESFLNNVEGIDLYASKGTINALGLPETKFNIIKKHSIVQILSFKVLCISKPHDAREALSFIIENKSKKLCFFTDLGHITSEITHSMKNSDILYVEANYCEKYIYEKMKHILNSQYLNRLMSDRGHLSLNQLKEVLLEVCDSSKKIILSHISENTNTYENAYTQIKKTLNDNGIFPQIYVSFQGEPTDWID